MEDERKQGLGPTVRNLRIAVGLTQEALAERAGISARTVSDVERGLRTAVYADTARQLATALGLSEDEQRRFHAVAMGGTMAALSAPTSALPAVPTPFLGRSDDLGVITAALKDRETRLLTLTGPGGIGKTRLALEAARRVETSFSGGLYFVSLGEVRDASLVASELAKAIGVVGTGEPLERLIVERLASRHVLIVLDTFEHLLAAAPLVYALMLGCSNAAILVTSRSALRLRGEREFPVPPLALPSEGIDRPDDLGRWPATALFVDRAQAVRPDLRLDAESAALMAEICQKLEGLPLAIELAAARVKHLPLTEVRDQLEHRLRLLVGGPLDLPRRQRAIRDTVGWSHDLLAGPERILFRRLSAFSGGWSLGAVEAVCGAADRSGDALSGVSALVDHSLVALDPGAAEARYDMLDTVREYASERLVEAGEYEEIGRRHALHYLELAEEAEPNLVRMGHKEWFAHLDVERGNFRRALKWTVERGETVLALRYTAALWRYWRQLGEFLEGRRWSEAALAIPGDAPISLRAKALWAAGALAFPQGDYARMAEVASESIELARLSEDPMDLRNALTIQGMVAMGEGRYRKALDTFAEALATCRPLGPSWQLATSHLNIGLALLHAGRLADAEAAFQEALQMYRQLGDDIFAARSTNHRAHVALMQGDFERAERLARDSLAGFSEHDERQGLADALETMAAVAAARAQPDRAATLHGAAAAIRETIAARPAPFEGFITTKFTVPARLAAGEPRWRLWWEAGHALSRAEALASALD